jgi:hypothetical protein
MGYEFLKADVGTAMTDWIAEEAKSTLKEHERQHFWKQLEQIEADLSAGVRFIKSIVQNPMPLKANDLNEFIEQAARFHARTEEMHTFFIQMVRYIDRKIPHQCTCRVNGQSSESTKVLIPEVVPPEELFPF